MNAVVKFLLFVRNVMFFLFAIAIALLGLAYVNPDATTEMIHMSIAKVDNLDEKDIFSTPEPAYMSGGFYPTTQSSDLSVVKAKKVKTCDELIKVWKPAHLPADVKVECDNAPLEAVGKTVYGLTTVQAYSPTYYSGYKKITLKKDGDINVLIDAYNHEAFHAVSYSWDEQKQAGFIKFMGGEDWSSGSYKERIGERWAWAATSCNGAKMKQFKGYENKVPGGCKAVKQWLAK